MEKSLETFQQKTEKITENVLGLFKNLKFAVYQSGKMLLEDWESHKNYGIEQEGSGLKFNRVGDDKSSSYFTALYKVPLNPFEMRVTILGVNSGDRYVDIGIITKSKYDTIKSGGY